MEEKKWRFLAAIYSLNFKIESCMTCPTRSLACGNAQLIKCEKSLRRKLYFRIVQAIVHLIVIENKMFINLWKLINPNIN